MSFDYERYAPCGDWWDCATDDAKTIGALIGFEISDIYFSGFSSQGDGACFEGYMSYRKGGAMALKAYAPTDETLHGLADRWQALQARCFYQLGGSVKHSGRYQHENCTSFDWEDTRDARRALPEGVEDEATDICRDYMRWIYRQLETEYEYQSAWQLARGWGDQGEVMAESRKEARALVHDMRLAIKANAGAPRPICAALRRQLAALLEAWEEARQERDAIADVFHYREGGQILDVAAFASSHL